MTDPVRMVLEHLDRPVRPRREFEDTLLRACLASLADAPPLPGAKTVADAAGELGLAEPEPSVRSAGLRRSPRWGRGSTHGRLRAVMVGIGTAALLGVLLVASLLLGRHGQLGPNLEQPGATSRIDTARYLDELRADYPTIAADVQRIGVRCVNMPSADLSQCRTYFLDLKKAAETMRAHLLTLAVPPTLLANDSAIRRHLNDLVAATDVQLSSIAAGRLGCCPVDDANGNLHDDVFSALGASPTGAPTG